jgi:hypothetical protein
MIDYAGQFFYGVYQSTTKSLTTKASIVDKSNFSVIIKLFSVAFKLLKGLYSFSLKVVSLVFPFFFFSESKHFS